MNQTDMAPWFKWSG